MAVLLLVGNNDAESSVTIVKNTIAH